MGTIVIVGLYVLYSLQAVSPVYQHIVPFGQSVDIVVGQDCKHISMASVIVWPHQNVSLDFSTTAAAASVVVVTATGKKKGCDNNSCSTSNSGSS